MTAAGLGVIAEVRPANVAVANVPADRSSASAGLRALHKAVTNVATVRDVKGLAADAVHVTSVTNANAVNRLRRCRRLALLCFRTTKASNRSRARFE